MSTMPLFLLVAVAAALAGCETATTPQKLLVAESGPSPSSPLSVKLTVGALAETPKIGSETDLTVKVSVHPLYDRTLHNTAVSIDLPEGITLISGNTKWTGDVSTASPIRLAARVKVVKEGNWSIIANATSPLANDSGYSNAVAVCYSASETVITWEKGKCAAEHTALPGVQETKPSQAECRTATDCAIAGCSGQLCLTNTQAENIFTTCEYREAYKCYGLSSCGCFDGKCEWDKNEAFTACQERYSGNAAIQ